MEITRSLNGTALQREFVTTLSGYDNVTSLQRGRARVSAKSLACHDLDHAEPANDASEILEKALREAGAVSQLAGIDWVQYADQNIDRAADETRALRGHAGDKLVERGNRLMNRVVRSPPYL